MAKKLINNKRKSLFNLPKAESPFWRHSSNPNFEYARNFFRWNWVWGKPPEFKTKISIPVKNLLFEPLKYF